ncbi:hypothetical protein AB1Y20_022398 [Prymnesium parvum]|uniref:Xylose isomerase-like TIM barrel domain-containing protein n=1 Tax=Prymnesium parvum TaxID=97485 RepID=A0AB34JG78_PRYPA
MVRHLRLLRSAWGLPHLRTDAPRAIAHARDTGFAGIEASLSDVGTPAQLRLLCAALQSEGLSLVLSAYSCWRNYEGPADARSTVAEHVAAFDRDLLRIAECHAAFPRTVLRANGHSGSDAWTEAEACDFFGAVGETASSAGLPLSHETHRGRYLCCPFATRRLIHRLPSLRLTLDFSHWVIKCERLLDTEEEATMLRSEIAPAVDHLHARIGTPQSPQLADVHSPLARRAAERFYSLWEDVWTAHETASVSSRSSVATATVEYGPREFDEPSGEYVGYTPVGPEGEPLVPHTLDETLSHASQGLLDRFDRWHAGSVRRRFPL